MPTLPIRWHIAILGFLIVAPLILVQGIILYQIAGSERARLERSTTDVAEDIAKSIDRVLQASEYTLLALSTSNFLDTGDLANFHKQASLVATQIPGAIIGLRDSTGQILVATARPPGSVFGTIDPLLKQTDEETFATRKTVIANVYKGATSGEIFVNVQLPIYKPDKRYILSLALTSQYIANLMGERSLGESWVASVIDRNNRIVARTRDNDRYAGQIASPNFLSQITSTTGRFTGRTLEGVDVMNGYVRSSYSGWLIAAATPFSILEAPIRLMIWQLGATAIVGWLLATLLALTYSRTFTTPLLRLRDIAAAGAPGQPETLPQTPVRELNILAEALTTAFEKISRHAADQSLLANEPGHRVKNTLATVQAISSLSIRHATSVEAFHQAFAARLSALARSHDLLLNRNWESSTLLILSRMPGSRFVRVEDVMFTAQIIILLRNKQFRSE